MTPSWLRRRSFPAGLALLAALGSSTLPAAAPAVAPAVDACAWISRQITMQTAPAVFLASYPDAEPGPLHQAAFLYDNAVAAIALTACDRIADARRIGDALLLALDHDRFWHDGRLRNGYLAGAVGAAPLKLAGWWSSREQRWLEDNYQAGSDSGNLAWAMLALLTLDRYAHEHDPGDHDGLYLAGATRLGSWLAAQRDRRGAGGFMGGSFGSETATRPLQWKSTEHNVDLAAAFAWLAASSGDAHWRPLSQAASRFVGAMWDPRRGAFDAGTREDGVNRNALLAIDAQVWPLLALPAAAARYHEAYSMGAQSLRTRDGAGYAYSEAGGGAWTEGTAMTELLRKLLNSGAGAGAAVAAIGLARAPDGGYFATTSATLPTGFMLDTDPDQPRVYRHLEHLGAAAWVALCDRGFDPFIGARSLPPQSVP
jgi:hypothetical protein